MTVKELIAELQKHDPEAQVAVDDTINELYQGIQEVRINAVQDYDEELSSYAGKIHVAVVLVQTDASPFCYVEAGRPSKE